MAKTNIFPLYLNADADTVTTSDADYTIVSSRVVIDASADSVAVVLVKAPEEDGTFVRFEKQAGSNSGTIAFVNASGSVVTSTLAANDDAVDLIYFGNQWRVVALYGTASVA